MPTTNKGLNQPVLGSTGWGTPLNENATILDLALGAFEIVAGTAGTVTLSTIQVQSMCLKSDTVAFTADVTYVVPSGVAGQWLVTNQSAPSAFSVIVKNAASATSVSVPNGQSRLVYSDGNSVIFSDYNVATQAQAEAKTDNSALMTPLRASQQVQSTIATQAQAIAGTDNTTLMTPLRVAQVSGYNYQEFTASGTWTKPAGAPANALVTVKMWSGGGSGGRATGTGGQREAGGGGGGGYLNFTMLASDLAATVAVVIGAGGAAQTSTSNGQSGGNTVFSFLTVFGGGGGILGASPAGGTRGFAYGGDSGGLGGIVGTPPEMSAFGGGGGAGASATNNNEAGANAIYGGAGGGSGLNGSIPSGGGGGKYNANSGAGERGLFRIWVQW
jgi:hypothetical protein